MSSSSQHNSSRGNNNEQDGAFLKIPRIRLKQKGQKSGTSTVPVGSSPPEQHGIKNNKFSYIENSHLVNPAMLQQQKTQNQQKQQQRTAPNHYSDEDEDDTQQVDANGRVLIKPKKLPNPIKESVAMQSIHRELLLNQKM